MALGDLGCVWFARSNEVAFIGHRPVQDELSAATLVNQGSPLPDDGDVLSEDGSKTDQQDVQLSSLLLDDVVVASDLEDEELDSICELFQQMDQHCVPPLQVVFTIIALVPKPKEGDARPIGILSFFLCPTPPSRSVGVGGKLR